MRQMTARVARWLVVLVALAGAVAAGLAAATVILVWHVNHSDYRRQVASMVEQSSGLIVSIDGTLHLGLTPLPTLSATDVRVANPPWSVRAEMMHIDQVDIEISPLDLLLHRNRLLRLALAGADLHLEADGHGRFNWWPGSAAGSETAGAAGAVGAAGGGVGVGGGAPAVGRAASEPLDISNLEISGSAISYVDDASGATVRLGVQRAAVRLPADGPMALRVVGDYFGTPFTGRFSGGRLADLIDDRPLWRASWRLDGVGTSLEAKGTIDHPLSARNLDLGLSLAGRHLAALGPVFGKPLPDIGPFALKTHLTGALPRYRLAEIKGSLGASDFAGQLTLEAGRPRLQLEGRLQSRVLRRLDLVGSAPDTWVPPADGHLLDARPLPFPLLLGLDGRVDLTVGRLVTQPLDLFDLDTTIDLVEGRLVLQPLRATLAGGRIDLILSADAGQDPPSLHISGRGDGMAAEQLFQGLGMALAPTGPVSIDLDLSGPGPSLRSFLAHANGRAGLTIGHGTLPVRHFDLVASDLVAAIMPWAIRTGDRTDLNCLVAHVKFRNGLADADHLLIDTGKITVTGSGEIDMASEQLNLRLDPRPKDPSLISLATPMRVTGTLADHSAAPDPVDLAKGAATGLVLAIGELNPLALMLPFISIGTGVANPCSTELAGHIQAALPPVILVPMVGLSGLLDSVGHAITHAGGQ